MAIRSVLAEGGVRKKEGDRSPSRPRPAGCRLPALAAAVWMLLAAATWAADPSKASSSRQSKEEAMRAIPLDRLDPAGRKLVRHVLDNVSVYRRLPTQIVRADPTLYHYFLDHPDVTVGMWRLLGLTDLTVQQSAAGRYELDDHQGTRGDVQFLYRSRDVHVVYTQGSYEGPLFPKPVLGHVIMLLRTGYVREPNGDTHITSRLDTFIRMENVGLDLIAKTFHPLAGRIIDDNFVEAMKFVAAFSRTAEVNPESLQALAERVQGVEARHQDQLIQVVADIGEKSRGRRIADTASRPRGKPAPK